MCTRCSVRFAFSGGSKGSEDIGAPHHIPLRGDETGGAMLIEISVCADPCLDSGVLR